MTSSDSFNRATRPDGVRGATPKRSNSSGTEPQPMPSSKRPPDAWSSVTAWRASIAGWRNVSHSTRWLSFSVSVDASSQPAVCIASYMSCCSASGGAKWSISAMPVKPAASAARARPTRSGIDMRICGRKRWNSVMRSSRFDEGGCGRRSLEAFDREVLVADLERFARPMLGAGLHEVELIFLEAQVGRERVHEEAGGVLADVALRLLDEA